jgi:hypothetical protein
MREGKLAAGRACDALPRNVFSCRMQACSRAGRCARRAMNSQEGSTHLAPALCSMRRSLLHPGIGTPHVGNGWYIARRSKRERPQRRDCSDSPPANRRSQGPLTGITGIGEERESNPYPESRLACAGYCFLA